MATSYNRKIENFRTYIENNFKIKLDESFKIENDAEYKNDTSLDWLKNIIIYNYEYTSLNEKVIFFKYINNAVVTDNENCLSDEKNGSYILVSSSDNIYSEISIEGFAKEIDLDLGIFLKLFDNLNYAPIINKDLSDEEIENILCAEKYLFDNIKYVFGDIKVFKINDKHLNSDQEIEDRINWIYRFLGILKCNCKLNNIKKEIYFTEEAILKFKNVFLEDIVYFPYENLYLSLSQNSAKYIFLDIYRIIEKLYPIIFCFKIKNRMYINNLQLLDIHSALEEELNWKHKEIDALKEIFDYCKLLNCKESLNCLEEYKNMIDIGKQRTHISRWIYDIRNTCVHLSFNDKKIVDINRFLRDDTIIKALIPIVSDLYKSIFM